MIRILHSVSYMNRGGIETMLMNYYRHMDRNKVQFDFLCNSYNEGAYDEEIQDLGGRIFRTPGFNPAKFFEYRHFMENLFAEHPEYKIVEAHNGALGVYALNAAKRANIPFRIYHAHGCGMIMDLKFPIKYLCKHLLKYNMNEHFVCSLKAGEYYMGKRIMDSHNYYFIPNAIDVNKFTYNAVVRDRIRNMFSIQDKIVIGHVGRFSPPKNHKFLLQIFAEASKMNPKLFLVLLGDGELRKDVERQAKALNIQHKIKFIGDVSNVNEWYQAFDLFLLPSLWEGLPVVGVEAQCADLPCIFSSAVTQEIALTPNVSFIDLSQSAKKWAECINSILQHSPQRKNLSGLITDKCYNIEIEAAKLQKIYLSFAEKY